VGSATGRLLLAQGPWLAGCLPFAFVARLPDAATPALRSACVITTLPIIAPGRVPGNTSAPRFPLRASASTASAWRDSGTRCGFAVFVASAGLTHTAALRSNCSQVGRRTSTCRDPVSAVNRIARFVEGAQFVTSIRASAPATSEKCSAG